MSDTADSTAGQVAGSAAGKLRTGSEAITQQELNVLGHELMGLLRQTGTGAALLAGAAVLVGLAAGSANTLLLRVYESFLPPRVAALAVTITHLGGAAALAFYARAQLKQVEDISRDTIGSVTEEFTQPG